MNKPASVTASREKILSSLQAWINQKPGLDPRDYGDLSGYRGEVRRISKQRAHALELLSAVALRLDISAADIVAASGAAFSGRLTVNPETGKIDYCTGQYWPTEYRLAAAWVLQSALWASIRAEVQAENPEAPENGVSLGELIRKRARELLSVSVYRNFFN